MDYHDHITCPKCGAEDLERGDYPRALEHDGDSAESECHDCGAAFLVTKGPR